MSEELALARLERRAARDKAARLEAEATAESQLRRAYENAREVELLAAIAVIVNESAGSHSALAAAAKAIRRHCRFAVSHVFVVEEDGAFVSADIWDADQNQIDFLERMVTATLDRRFFPPDGLPGQVAASHQSIWIQDAGDIASATRQADMRAGAAWAFPVLVGVDVVAVLEFLSPSPRHADERLLQLAPALGAQLGRAIEWERAEERGVADRKRLEELLQRRTEDIQVLQRQALMADQARDSFLGFLAHDAAQSLQRLIEQLPALSSVDSVTLSRQLSKLVSVVDRGERRFTGERQTIELLELSRAVLVPYEHLADRRVVERIEGSANVSLDMNVELLTRGVAFLVDNALTHTDSEVIEVVFGLRSDELIVDVIDSGSGYVWDPSARVIGGGGLSQAARIARALGGSFELSSESANQTRARLVVATRTRLEAVESSSGQRVLLVDDNDINRKLAGAMLNRIGVDADVVDGGIPALAAMKDKAYGLILMDVRMPDLDGREATKQWRESPGGATRVDVPIVALTAHVAESERADCLSAGMNDYLSKPFGIDGLQGMVRRWLDATADA